MGGEKNREEGSEERNERRKKEGTDPERQSNQGRNRRKMPAYLARKSIDMRDSSLLECPTKM